MASDLYRPEAYASRIRGFSNPVTIRGSLSATLMMLALLALVGGLVTYAWLTPYSRKVQAPGFVSPITGSITVTSPSDGIVRLAVENGDHVEHGQLLAVITKTLDIVGEKNVTAMRLEMLNQQRDLLDERISLTQRRIPSTERNFSMLLANAEQRLASQERILSMQREERARAEKARERVAHLVSKGFSTTTRLDDASSALILADQRLIDAEVTVLEMRERMETLIVERELELSSLRQEELALRNQRLDLRDEIYRLGAEIQHEVYAPVSGTVTFTRVRNLERTSAQQPLFRIDPADTEQVATILAPSSAIGFVAEGDKVRVRYDAYPYREHGVFSGTVISIDNTSQRPEEFNSPIGGLGPVYRVTARIEQAPVNKRGAELRIVSGMTLEASIIADDKPILFWLIDPVL